MKIAFGTRLEEENTALERLEQPEKEASLRRPMMSNTTAPPRARARRGITAKTFRPEKRAEINLDRETANFSAWF